MGLEGEFKVEGKNLNKTKQNKREDKTDGCGRKGRFIHLSQDRQNNRGTLKYIQKDRGKERRKKTASAVFFPMFLFCYSVRANSTEKGAETSLIKSCKGRGCTCEKVKRILPTQVQTLKTACILLCWRCRRKKCNCLQGQTKATRRSVIVGDRVNTKIATVIRAEL